MDARNPEVQPTVTTMADVHIDTPLTPQEQQDFRRLEELVRDGFSTMEKMAGALREIRQRKLYRKEFRTFDSYVRTKWDMCIRRAYQICTYGEVIENLRAHNCAEIPEREAQARELAKLPSEAQAEVWNEVVRKGKPTAAAIAKHRRREKSLHVPAAEKRAGESPNSNTMEVAVPAPMSGTLASPPEVGINAAVLLKQIWDRSGKMARRDFLFSIFGNVRGAISTRIWSVAAKGAPKNLGSYLQKDTLPEEANQALTSLHFS